MVEKHSSFAFDDVDMECVIQVGLQPFAICPVEEQLFLKFLKGADKNEYLSTRNYIIKIWHTIYPDSVMSFQMLRTQFDQKILDESLALKVFKFLDRYRYINYGFLKTKAKAINEDCVILVIGAGIAGLTTAREICNIYMNQQTMKLPRIIVLEARKRVGDSGPIKHMISQLGLEAIHSDTYNLEDCQIYDYGGTLITKRNRSNAKEFVNDLLASIEKYRFAGSLDQLSIGEILQRELMSHPLYAQLNATHLNLIRFYLSNIEVFTQSSLEKMSHYSPSPLVCPENMYTLPGGLGQLPHAMAYGFEGCEIPIDIKCDAKVESVKLQNNCIEVTADGTLYAGSGSTSKYSQGFLLFIQDREIVFSPRLPSKKIVAMDQLQMGILNKMVLVFPRIFWALKDRKFGSLGKDVSHDTTGRSYLFLNMYESTQLPCLEILIAGYSAYELEDSSDDVIVRDIMGRLSAIFPEERPLPYPIETIITRWSHDVFSKGSSSFLKAGGDPNAFHELMADSRRLYLAGDHVSATKPGTIEGLRFINEGALMSGRDAARKLADQLLGPIEMEIEFSIQ